MRHGLALWRVLTIALVASLLSSCGSSTPGHIDAQASTDTSAPSDGPPVSVVLTPPAADHKIPPGPSIGSFIQPKDVIVMVDRDETVANDNIGSDDLTGLGKAIGIAKVVDIIADDTSSWFTRYGPTNCGTVGVCWKEASIGYSGHMWWTWNNKYTTSNYGIWAPTLQCPGVFSVSAFIPNNNATTTKAPYTINHANGTSTYNINQNNYYSQWVGMGSHTFNKSGSSVKLIDATGEAGGTKKIGFDAMKWSWQSASPNTWLTVSYPNGGETLYKSDCIPIYWNSSGLNDNVRIHLYRYGSIYKGLNNNTANDGYECISASSFSNVSDGGGYTIGMSNVNSYCDGTTYDFSNSAFTITSPSITVSSPGSGTYTSGNTISINWSTVGVSGNIKIDLYLNGGFYTTITSSTSNSGSYNWSSPSSYSGTGYSIRVSSTNDSSVYGTSSGTFTLAKSNAAPVTTISTNGGSSFTTTQSSTTLSGSCTDVDSNLYQANFYDNIWDYTANISGGNWSFNQSVPLQNGGNIVYITCYDTNGLASSKNISITSTQTGTISGTVTSNSGGTLPGATVKVIGPLTKTTTTNSNGQYTLSLLTPGSYSAQATMSGYLDSSVQNISVSAGNTSGANFVLTKIPLPSLYYSPNSISVSGMNSGSINSTQSFVIKNNGDATLTYTLSPDVSWASIQRNGATVSGVQQSLTPGIQAAFTIVFNSNGITASQSGTVAITSNDATQGTPTISLNMGINAPPPPAQQPPPPAEQPAPSTPPLQPAQYGPCQTQNRCYADPVNTAIGNYTYQHADLAIAARGPDLIFTRHYNSLDTTIGPLGMGWTHGLNVYLVIAGNGDIYVRWGSGQTDWHVYNSSTGGFTPPAGVFDQLTHETQYILTDKDQNVWAFSSAGQLQSVTDRLNNKLTLAYDSQGRLTTATNSIGDTFSYAYLTSTDSRLASVTDSTNRTIQFAYNGNLLTQVTDAKGNSFALGYDGGNRLNQITERDGKVLVSNIYDSSNRVTTQTDALGNVTQFAYNSPAPGQTTVTDPTGKAHTYAYDSLYRLISQKGPTGDTVSFLYTTANLPTQVTDANGKVTTSTYDSRGNVLSVTDAAGAKVLWTYDVLDRMTSTTSPLGQTTSYSYDTNGNLSQISDTLGGTVHTTTLNYLSTGELSDTTDPMGAVTTYAYNSKGELTSVKNANNEVVQFGYDGQHRRTSVTDPLGHSRSTAYDANDNATSTTNALNQTTTITYDAREQPGTVAAPSGTTTTTYDAAGRLTQIAAPSGITTYGYNTVNQQTSVTDPAGSKTTFVYNTLGYLTGMTDATGKGVTFSYDPMGNLLSSTDTAGKTTSFTLDAIGRPTKVTDPLGNTVTATYNSAGQATQTADPAGNAFKTTFDNFGRPTQATNALQGVTAQTYDKNSRLTQLTTPSGTAFGWTYDAVGRTTSHTSPSGKKKSFVYDAAGRLSSFTNASNQTTTVTYDAGDRITQTSFADGVIRGITYDTANRPTQIALAGKARTYSYDTAGRISSSVDAWGKAISYIYDSAGRLTTLTYPGNKTVTYGYDAAGRLTSVTDWNGGVTTYTYDSAGRLQQIGYPNGVKTVHGYDGNSRVTGVQHKQSDGTVFYGQTIAYDIRGNITSVDISPEPSGWITTATANYSTNTEDQYTDVGSDLLAYDLVGQLLSKTSGSSYAFDARERLTSATTSAASGTFIYGPEGERIQKVIGGTTTRYVVDTNRSLPAVLTELDAASVPSTYYIYGIGLVAQTPATGSAIHYYHSDIQSNIVALTDGAGAVTDTYFYHPFGKVLAKTGTTANPYQFAGALGVEQDETGLIYMRARYYDPVIGRFITKDPLGLAAGTNQYDYAGASPMNYTDPSGEVIELLGIAAVWLAKLAVATTATFIAAPHIYAYMVSETVESTSNYIDDPTNWNAAIMALNIAGMAPIGGTGKALSNGAKGKLAEEVVSDLIGVKRNVGKGLQVVKGTGKGGFRIPDFPTAATIASRGTIVESKNAMKLSLTKQIRDFQAVAKSKGVPLEIFIRPNTHLYQPLLDQIGKGPGQIIFNYIPKTSQASPFILGPVGSAVESMTSGNSNSGSNYFDNLSGPACYESPLTGKTDNSNGK